MFDLRRHVKTAKLGGQQCSSKAIYIFKSSTPKYERPAQTDTEDNTTFDVHWCALEELLRPHAHEILSATVGRIFGDLDLQSGNWLKKMLLSKDENEELRKKISLMEAKEEEQIQIIPSLEAEKERLLQMEVEIEVLCQQINQLTSMRSTCIILRSCQRKNPRKKSQSLTRRTRRRLTRRKITFSNLSSSIRILQKDSELEPFFASNTCR